MVDMNRQVMLRHSGPGIASFVIALLVLVCVFLLFAVAGVLHNSGQATPQVNTIVGVVLIFFWLLALVGVILGIVGVVDRNSKKTFSILGLVIGGLVLLLSIAAVLVGIKMNSGA